ncbi:hypothetical protein VTI28DRAFT_8738 [Corynascus sepedonium]
MSVGASRKLIARGTKNMEQIPADILKNNSLTEASHVEVLINMSLQLFQREMMTAENGRSNPAGQRHHWQRRARCPHPTDQPTSHIPHLVFLLSLSESSTVVVWQLQPEPNHHRLH